LSIHRIIPTKRHLFKLFEERQVLTVLTQWVYDVYARS